MSKEKPLSHLSLLFFVRDSGATRNAERQMLDALILRCQPAKAYVSWPSYAQLAEDTGLSVKTLRRAAQVLEEAKLIKRSVRANTSNKWWVNAAEIQRLALDARERKLAARQDDADDCPFDAPQPDGDENNNEIAHASGAAWMTGGAR